MNSIEQRMRSIREDRRADYLWETKRASSAVGCVPNKFGDWWSRTRGKLVALSRAMPRETAAELAAIFAEEDAND